MTLDRYVTWVAIALVPVTVIELTKLARRLAGHRRASRGPVVVP